MANDRLYKKFEPSEKNYSAFFGNNPVVFARNHEDPTRRDNAVHFRVIDGQNGSIKESGSFSIDTAKEMRDHLTKVIESFEALPKEKTVVEKIEALPSGTVFGARSDSAPSGQYIKTYKGINNASSGYGNFLPSDFFTWKDVHVFYTP